MKMILKLAAALTLSLTALSGQAATIYSNQTITQVAVGGAYGGDVVLRISGHNSMSKPACATDSSWSLRFDGTTEVGKQMLSMAVLAQSTGVEIDLSGEDFCNDSATALRWIRLK